MQIDFLEKGKPKSLFIHEVWWSDLDNKISLWERLKFWGWTFGQWGYVRYSQSRLPGFQKMQLPVADTQDPLQQDSMVRLRLWVTGVIFLMAMLRLVPLGYLLRRFGIATVGPDIFYQYLGDVKLYQDYQRPLHGTLTDVGHPPRVPIRRRMIRVLVDAYFVDYDRWYVLAHSLGSVLAWNGLMETTHCLPNYLDQETWRKCLADGQLTGKQPGVGPVDVMRPDRPIWIQDDDAVIDRKILFSRLRGLVTYGSPLDKFAYMWGAIVPINPDKTVFDKKFEWLNIFDHTDPVAEALRAYQDAPCPPQNYSYKASPLLLLSHIH